MKNLLLVCVCFLFSISVFAQKETIENEVQTPVIIQLMQKSETTRKMVSASMILQLPENLEKEQEIRMEIYMVYMKKVLPILEETLTPAYMEVYQEHFTEEELEELLAFYNTDLGRKLLDAEYEMYVNVFSKVLKNCKKELEESVNEVLTKRGIKE